ncbi:hypothetical protein Fmac_001868 [Flemingia macrophylla]|uniref:Uncharacterized protein n=1 Tax=Flemingia macrophylla TaxID=520843 RepID=A0ABD1NK09_9FABA
MRKDVTQNASKYRVIQTSKYQVDLGWVDSGSSWIGREDKGLASNLVFYVGLKSFQYSLKDLALDATGNAQCDDSSAPNGSDNNLLTTLEVKQTHQITILDVSLTHAIRYMSYIWKPTGFSLKS